jgi:hypothetical protein
VSGIGIVILEPGSILPAQSINLALHDRQDVVELQ